MNDLYDFRKQDRFYRVWTVVSFTVTMAAYAVGAFVGRGHAVRGVLYATVAIFVTNIPVGWYRDWRRQRRASQT
jgi:hypothetical protein